jgi:hypothetical protein
MGKKRVLFGAVDIGYRIEYYSKWISRHLSDKLEAESFSKYVLPASHFKTKYTYICPINKVHPFFFYFYLSGFFVFSLFRYDIFHFFSGETILTRKLRGFEFWVYRLLGKKIIMHFVGADIRSPKYLDWKRDHFNDFLEGKPRPGLTEPFQKRLIADTRKYADHILVSTPDLLEIVPEAIYFPVVLDFESFLEKPAFDEITIRNDGEKKRITILHSPSGLRTKGSPCIHEVLRLLVAEFGNQIEIITPGELSGNDNSYSLTRYELIRQMSNADIVIDQMVIGWYGLISIEALALGCEVICYIDNNLEIFQFPDFPVINANYNSLRDILTRLVKGRLGINITADNHREWVRKYHTLENNNEGLLKAWFH